MESNRPNWNNYFMSIAKLASSRSSCSRLNVGCVLTKDNHLISMGYNGFLPGAPHTSRIVNNHEVGTVHAEQNAICDAAKRGISIDGSTSYITHFPCLNCFKLLVASGIKRIYYNEDYKNDKIVEEMAIENSIEMIKLEI
jgi:dCMP deaminase